ncbi:hypothetical protein Bca52824_002730 [Brassica carinata]|uniref:Glycine hydroxymethyltransferase n=1 Tax=Brassica carinata TaxID=52824 RepID=A0A8X7WLR2_BRACI|nr:hypothetical protein Bca52824_002730 [Brassica carinata]
MMRLAYHTPLDLGCQEGGPDNIQIAALAIALKKVAIPENKACIQQMKKMLKLVTGVVLGSHSFGLNWYENSLNKVFEMCHINLNKTAIFGDNGTISPGGVTLWVFYLSTGKTTMTTRGRIESDFERIADFLMKAAHITSAFPRNHGKPHNPTSAALSVGKREFYALFIEEGLKKP